MLKFWLYKVKICQNVGLKVNIFQFLAQNFKKKSVFVKILAS